jgi:hypothetical protein
MERRDAADVTWLETITISIRRPRRSQRNKREQQWRDELPSAAAPAE